MPRSIISHRLLIFLSCIFFVLHHLKFYLGIFTPLSLHEPQTLRPQQEKSPSGHLHISITAAGKYCITIHIGALTNDYFPVYLGPNLSLVLSLIFDLLIFPSLSVTIVRKNYF